MRILYLAPHPFFQERGTPIDDLLVLKVLAERTDTTVDLLVFNEGENVHLPGLTIYRTPDYKLTQNIRPGFSLKKLVADFFLFLKSFELLKKNKYDLIHAGEEAVFFAMFFKLVFKIPYVYDLDSSIAQQLVEKVPMLSPFAFLFNYFEKKAIQNSLANLPVCNALADLCERNSSKKTVTLHDISQLKNPDLKKTGKLGKELGTEHLILLYSGNLEAYQGIDLLLKSFQLAIQKVDNVDLVIIGGTPEDLIKYKEMAKKLRIDKRSYFLGPKPFKELDYYLTEADILVAPRIKGINTPMKIFPYLHSGKPVLLTDLYTHNQLVSSNEAFLAPANPGGFTDGIITLAKDRELRKRLGENGRLFVEKNHTFTAHKKRVNYIYNWIENQISNNSSKHCIAESL